MLPAISFLYIRPSNEIDELKAFTPLSADNLDGHMIFGMNGRQCRTTMANGRLLYKDRQFVDIDEEKLSAQILATAQKLWGRVNS